MAMQPADRKKYDDLVDDLIIATIQLCETDSAEIFE